MPSESGKAAVPLMLRMGAMRERRVAEDQVFMLLCCFVAVSVLYLSTQLWKAFYALHRGNKLPGPRASLLWGNLPDMKEAGGIAGFAGYLERLHAQYGCVVRIWLGPGRLFVSLRDAETAKAALVHARDRPGPPQGVLDSMVFQGEEEARLARSFFDYHCHTTLLYRGHDLATTVAEMAAEIFTKKAANQEEVDVKKTCRWMATGVIGAAIYGEKFLTTQLHIELSELTAKVAEGQQFLWSSVTVPFWRKEYKDYLKNNQRIKEISKELLEMAISASKEAKTEFPAEPTISDVARRAALAVVSEEFISAMLAERTVLGEKLFTEEGVQMGSLGLMFHGCLTTATVLSRAFVFLAQHPEMQMKVHQELDLLCGPLRPPPEARAELLHFLTAAVHESARLAPLQPALRRCSLGHDLKAGDFIIPAGAIIAIPTHSFHMDPHVWGEDSSQFNPDRFIKRQIRLPEGPRMSIMAQSLQAAKANAGGWRGAALTYSNPGPKLGSDVVTTSPSPSPSPSPSLSPSPAGRRAFDPRLGIEGSGHINRGGDCYAFVDPGAGPHFLLFGAGPRSCVGKRFALQLVRSLLAATFQRFEVRFSPGTEANPSLEMEGLMLNFTPNPKIIFSPR